MSKPSPKANIYREKLITALSKISKTEEGCLVLNHLFRDSGFVGPLTVVNNNGILDVQGTLHNNARRDVYDRLRRFMIPEVIKAVEFDFKIEEEVPKDVSGSEPQSKPQS